MVSLPEEGIFDQSLKGTKKQVMGLLGSIPGRGSSADKGPGTRARALGQGRGPWGKDKVSKLTL